MSGAATTYDEVPYLSKPLFSTHPDLLAAAGRLRGLKTPSPSNCRVLELGCAAGGNLIPMAYALPESRFVGIDLSTKQIEDGQALCRQLELQNIKLSATSIADIDESFGQFDYIICHGVYSWVPPAIQERILWICRHLLSPNGVAYISYNTYPGWHLRSIVRDLMKFHAARFEDPSVKVQQARSILSFMAEASASLNSPLSRVLAEEADDLPDAADYYLFHEHLEDHNQPLYFHEFVARARQAGLEYVGEAWHHTHIDNLPPEVQETLQAISRDLIDLEQFVDFIRSRTFRRTLLCHSENQIVQTPPPSVMDDLFITTLVRPQSDTPDIGSDAVEKFVLDNGTTASTNAPVLKVALVTLFERWPQAVAFHDLLAAVVSRLNLAGDAADATRPLLTSFLAQGYVSHLVAVHCEPFRLTTTVTERPRASRLVRVLAASQTTVPNLRHRLIALPPLAKVVASLADGTRTSEQIASEAGRLEPELIDEQLKMGGDQTTAETVIRQTLNQLARSAILEA
ncbi:MAG TPA: class I SAM-dependent methyltransferase [Pirellulaceae bacterium]|jgi:methyltransferase-like protein/16S rRNA G527 N7-methylase RsmG